LIEKARSVVTDGSGQYKIVDLRPGIYSVSFALPGFTVQQREGIELTANFVADVNAKLTGRQLPRRMWTFKPRFSSLDVQSTTQQSVLTRSVMDNIPTGTVYSPMLRFSLALR